MPLYLADEESGDTKALVERYFKVGFELADIARESEAMKPTQETSFQLKQEDMMKAHNETKQFMFWNRIILAALIAFSTFALLVLGIFGTALFFLGGL